MLYIFLGADTFSRREALQKLKGGLDQDGMLTTNTLVLDARQTTPGEVISACNAVPFFGPCRLVIVEGVLQSAERPRRRSRKREAAVEEVGHPWQALVECVDTMPETTTLVLVDETASDDALLESLRGKGKIERFDLLKQPAVSGWIQRRAQERGLKLDARAARLLADAVGADSWMLANEIEKLAIYADGQIVRETDVRALVSRIRERQGYLLADAVAERLQEQALKLLHVLVIQGEPGQVLLSTVAGRYRRMAVAREMLDAGMSDSKVGQQLRTTGYPLERIIEQAGRWPPAKIRHAMIRIAQADADIKSGTYEEELSLELLVHDLTGDRSARAA